MPINPIALHMDVTVCKDADDAVARGFNWSAETSAVKPIALKQVVVVENGTQSGGATLDFLVEDENGQRYVFITTARLLAAIPAVAKCARGEL